MVRCLVIIASFALGVSAFIAGCAPDKKKPAMPEGPHVMAKTPEEAGRYLVNISGCNDCHTNGFLQQGDAIPEEARLTGMPIGFKGPWGVTYPSNLRLLVQEKTEDQLVAELKERTAKPPMPWTSIHALNEHDLRSILKYIKSLGPAGEKTPDYVPPNQQPTTPVFVFVPVMPDGSPMPMPESGGAPPEPATPPTTGN
jgi:cytochrome c553